MKTKNKSWKAKILVDGDYSGSVTDVVDSANQSLSFRVGSVYVGKRKSPKKGLWINYQIEHQNSSLQGPVLLSKENWNELKKIIDKQFSISK